MQARRLDAAPSAALSAGQSDHAQPAKHTHPALRYQQVRNARSHALAHTIALTHPLTPSPLKGVKGKDARARHCAGQGAHT
jgi:hypothetical protein